MERKEKLEIKKYNYRDTEYIALYSEKNKLIKRFEYKEKAPKIKSLSTTNETNEMRIREYYQNKSHSVYTPTATRDYTEQLNTFIPNNKIKNKEVLNFKNENRLIFTKNKNIKQFDYMYINVAVKVYFDGHYIIARGRSDYVYGRTITDREEYSYIRQAIKRAIAPYGSNLKFKLLNWSYAYHQQKYIDFNKEQQTQKDKLRITEVS